MAIHGLKSELEWPRYHENRDNAPIDAPQTCESHNFWSDRWIFKIHTFSKTGSQNLSKGIKINPIHGLLKVAALEGLSVALQGRLPLKVCQGYKRPQAPFRLEETTFFWIFISTRMLSAHFSSLPNTKNTHQSLLILLSSPKTQDIVPIPNLLFLGSIPWDLGFSGVDIAF